MSDPSRFLEPVQPEPNAEAFISLDVGPTLLALLAEKGYTLRVRVDGLEVLEPE